MAHAAPLTHPFTAALDRLEALLHETPTMVVAALEQARACGAEGYRAGERLEHVVEITARLVPAGTVQLREFPAAVVEAAMVGFLSSANEEDAALVAYGAPPFHLAVLRD